MSNDDFETFDPQEAMPKQSVSASEIFKNNPSLKIFSVVAVVGVIIAGLLVFGGEKKETPVSKVAGKSEISEVPGSAQLTPEYKKAVEEKDKQRIEEAVRTGQSVFPTPVSRAEERIDAPEVDKVAEDPLEVWRKTVEEKSILSGTRRDRMAEGLSVSSDAERDAMAKRFAAAAPVAVQQPVPQPVQQLPSSPTKEEIDMRSQLVLKQMGTILETKVPKPASMISLGEMPKTQGAEIAGGVSSLPGGLNPISPMGAEGGQGYDENGDDLYSDKGKFTVNRPVIMPGDIAYAQMMTEANSEVVGPIMAYIASGPLAGARALGTFSKTDKHLVMTFTSAVLKKEQYTINAYAVDPATTLTAMATDVDNHYFGRIVIPAATAFLEGFADAVKDSGNTTVIVSGETVTTETKDLELEDELLEGASEAIKQISEVVEETTPDEPTVRVEAGTRFGLLFMQPVYKKDIGG